ncbi:MAG: 5-formyltetrahydrofolate cyclo-ligase [Pseudomonadota bacterium]
MDSAAYDKKDLRKKLRERRRSLTPYQRKQAAIALFNQLKRMPLLRKARSVATYITNDGEISPAHLSEWLWKKKTVVSLSTLHPLGQNRLWFYSYTSSSLMRTNRYRILEPLGNFRERIALEAIDVILTPLVGFDSLGNRLGMGKGFYDRTLTEFKNRQSGNTPRLIGIAFNEQEVSQLPTDDWDYPLTAIVTPSRTLYF